MTEAANILLELSDCVVNLQGRTLPACSQVLGLQSEVMADMLRETKLERTADGRRVVPFAEDEPAMAQLVESLHMSTRERKSLVARLGLAEVARILSLAVQYKFLDLAVRVLTDMCPSRWVV